ncbi:hypothetical protein BDZ97DRAFT_1130396 [Flammula alnicola]|nr:hypothetical protein BDZ97DRAFT_1130396 [Flammula alnicola]
MAEAAHQEGNASYKAGQLTKAENFFNEATRLDPKTLKHASNLSAVQYELGKYLQCVQAIVVSWQGLRAQHAVNGEPTTPPTTDPLALKLATRFAKARINGFSNKSMPLHVLSPSPISAGSQNMQTPEAKAIEADIENFVFLGRDENGEFGAVKVAEMVSIWKHWLSIREECARHTAGEYNASISDAKARLRAMSIFKSPSDPVNELYNFGHDRVRSLLDGINGVRDDSDSIKLEFFADEERKKLSFLFGGSGDARHVFGTLIDVADSTRNLPLPEQRNSVDLHMTLVDIHPATLARTLIVLALVLRIIETRRNEGLQSQLELELHTTLFYVYMSLVMPEYCYIIFVAAAETLADELLEPRKRKMLISLHINEQSIPATVEVLKYWSSPLPKSTKLFLQTNSALNSQGLGPPLHLAANSDRKKLAKGLAEDTLDAYDDPEAEGIIYDKTKILLPPKALVSRHPALAKLATATPFNAAPRSAYKAAAKEIEDTWKVNPTLFDKNSTEHPDLVEDNGYLKLCTNPYDTLITFLEFMGRYQKLPRSVSGMTSFSVSRKFFDLVGESIGVLQDRLTLELVAADVTTALPRLFAGDLGPRPNGSPTDFTRMWLSNVPDYTNGVLNIVVDLVPHLSHNLKALVSCNCLLNSPAFKSIAEICYNYTLLHPRDLPRFLGGNLMDGNSSPFGDIVVTPLPLPRPLDELASKRELHAWLADLLLCILCNAPSLPSPRIELPNNLTAFFQVLIHLHRVGFPAHWLGDFVQYIVSDNLVTDATPYLGLLPVPPNEPRKRKVARKVNLRVWQANIEVILASVQSALPFAVSLPQDYPTLQDIQTYKARVKPRDFSRDPLRGPLSSPFIRSIGLLFYAPNPTFDAEQLASRISRLLEGDPDLRTMQVQIMLSQESVNLRTGEISWKMNQQWYKKMQREQWKMVVYRTDMSHPASAPLSADNWIEASQ